MRKFDPWGPWPIFFRREWNRNWPFLVGFAVTLITKKKMPRTPPSCRGTRGKLLYALFGDNRSVTGLTAALLESSASI